MNPSLYRLFSLLIILTLCGPTSAWGVPSETKKSQLTAGMELFRWQEFDANQVHLLTEEGLRLTLQLSREDILPRYGQINIKTWGYGGAIEYDGATWDGVALISTSRYFGLGAEMEALGAIDGLKNTNALIGLGVDWWRRDIQDSTDVLGNAVSGIIEDYLLLYAITGLQWQHPTRLGHGMGRIGLKRPLWVYEQVNIIESHLNPNPDWSWFASYRLQLSNRYNSSIELYYDGLRLDPSPAVASPLGPVLQPQSQYDRIGIMVGIPF